MTKEAKEAVAVTFQFGEKREENIIRKKEEEKRTIEKIEEDKLKNYWKVVMQESIFHP